VEVVVEVELLVVVVEEQNNRIGWKRWLVRVANTSSGLQQRWYNVIT
jgi:hypothetical protein